LIARCRTVAGWFTDSQLRGDVFGVPSLSFGDGVQQQHGPRWHVGIRGCRAFPHITPVLRAVRGPDTDSFEELPNKRAALGSVVIQRLVRYGSGRLA
jgi:hypothetical protein